MVFNVLVHYDNPSDLLLNYTNQHGGRFEYNKASKLKHDMIDDYGNEWNYEEFLSMMYGGARDEQKWKTLEHNGVMFPPEYEPHNVTILYDGEPVKLTPEQEEYASFYARFLETDYVKNRTFNKNFWHDWRKLLGKEHKIKEFEKCDFRPIYDYLLKDKEKKADMTKEEKEKQKNERLKLEEKYKFCIIDGKKEAVGNFRIEPPGIFLGRGCHPLIGHVKPRVYPEEIILNIGKEAKVPTPFVPGSNKTHKWGEVIHDQTVTWLASWKESITGKNKYVWLAASSQLKSESDINKFETARKLQKKINQIRRTNNENMNSRDVFKKQLATALYIIDNFALRVGNEKGEDQADTVGVVSLRVEHIELLPENKIKLDFLGKDSIRYVNTVTVDPIVYENFQEFIKGKPKDEEIFDKISTQNLNEYLSDFMDGLTAKVFRTYNASYRFQQELNKITMTDDIKNMEEKERIDYLLYLYNKANKVVAELCNHQKNASKNFNEQVDKINKQIKELKKKKKEYQEKKKHDKVASVDAKIKKLMMTRDIKTELKTLSLGTSRANYIDPRITVSFFKRMNLPLEKAFTSALMQKFTWAMDTPAEYQF
jgi:DNA topoisomerase-1